MSTEQPSGWTVLQVVLLFLTLPLCTGILFETVWLSLPSPQHHSLYGTQYTWMSTPLESVAGVTSAALWFVATLGMATTRWRTLQRITTVGWSALALLSAGCLLGALIHIPFYGEFLDTTLLFWSRFNHASRLLFPIASILGTGAIVLGASRNSRWWSWALAVLVVPALAQCAALACMLTVHSALYGTWVWTSRTVLAVMTLVNLSIAVVCFILARLVGPLSPPHRPSRTR